MKVTANTLPRSSPSDRREPAWVVNVNSGAGPTTGNRAFSLVACAHAGKEGDSSKASNSAPPRNGRRVMLDLEFLLELIEEAPVRPRREQALRRRLDHAGLVEAQRVVADCVGGVEFAPPVVWDLFEGLNAILVLLDEASIRKEASDAVRLAGAQTGARAQKVLQIAMFVVVSKTGTGR